ncbi:MAG TPA: porin [Bacteroidales bacterium]|nr:porin [Bacteroidales bacterium]
MRRLLLLSIILLTEISLQAQPDAGKGKSPVSWNGYSQLRFTGNFNNINSFSVRRMKLWVQSAPGFNEHWGFKLQTTLSSNQSEKFVLQDVMSFYRQGLLQIKFGQFVPQFGLQWSQPDYTIPVVERANVSNVLIPDGTLGGRDIGIEANYGPAGNKWHIWGGAFNGNGIKEYNLINNGVLLTHKAALNLLNNHLYMGYSFMFRKAGQIHLSRILPDSIVYSGKDFRYNLFASLNLNIIQLQAEYTWADLDGMKADGWYLLAAADLGKSQLVASWDNYNDLIINTENSHTLHLGYNYLLKGDNLKFMIDNGIVDYNRKRKDYFLTLQVQLFFM